jgi:predicted nuclease with TOPRIM domain
MSNEIFLQQYAKSAQETAGQLLADLIMMRTQAALKLAAEAEQTAVRDEQAKRIEELQANLNEVCDQIQSLTKELEVVRHTLKVTKNAYEECQRKLADVPVQQDKKN